MITVSGLTKSFGGRTLFEGVTFKLMPGRRVALVGASTGGRVVLHAAARAPRQVDAVVTLSAERTGRSGFPTVADARHLRSPALYVGTTEGGYTTFGAETRT